MSNSSLDNFIAWLEARYQKIMAAEKEALRLLQSGDKKGYRGKMLEKAELLESMLKESSPLIMAIPQPERSKIEEKVAGFSQSAAMSIQLNSPFYMSALLYPDDHKAGEPDNLIKFITELKHIK